MDDQTIEQIENINTVFAPIINPTTKARSEPIRLSELFISKK